jgi:hypothetical protein
MRQYRINIVHNPRQYMTEEDSIPQNEGITKKNPG